MGAWKGLRYFIVAHRTTLSKIPAFKFGRIILLCNKIKLAPFAHLGGIIALSESLTLIRNDYTC